MLLITNQLIGTSDMSQLIFSLTFWTWLYFYLNVDEKTRVQSGKTLESNIEDRFCHFPIQLVDFLKSECLLALDDPSPVIRATVFVLIETILIKIEKFSNWPGIYPKLSQMLDSTENSDLEGTFRALQSTNGGFSSELTSIAGLHNELISKLLQFSNHTIPEIRL